MRTVLIINPTSGVSLLAETHHDIPESNEEMILSVLRTYGIEPEVWHTTLEDTGEGMAKKAADEHVDLVIAAGGDGTVHDVLQGIAGRDAALGIIPLGTANAMAHDLRLPMHAVGAARPLLPRAVPVELDAVAIRVAEVDRLADAVVARPA